MANHHEEAHDREPVDTRPYLCIPYWTTPRFPGDSPDNGELRPLPGDVIGWLCPSISASAYRPGARLDVRVDVVNSGRGSVAALATVLVYWADATVGFAKPQLLGAASVAVPPRGGRATTPTISGVIPATASDHICLLCVVTHSLDKAGSVADPAADRHWAQRNLTAVAAQPGAPALQPFLAANPFDHGAAFRLSVQMLPFDLLHVLARRLDVAPAEIGVEVQLLDDAGNVIAEGPAAEVSFDLDAYEQRRFNIGAEIRGELERDQIAAVEAVLVSAEGEHPVGSLGVVLRHPDAPPLPQD